VARFNSGDIVRLDVTFLPDMQGTVVEVKPDANGKASLAIYVVEFDGEIRLELNPGQIVPVRLDPSAPSSPSFPEFRSPDSDETL
jgi:hypothetical protein